MICHTDHISDLTKYIVNNVMQEYGSLEPWKLSELSHCEISWKNSRMDLDRNAAGMRKLSIEDIREDAKKIRPYDHVWDMYYDEFEIYTIALSDYQNAVGVRSD